MGWDFYFQQDGYANFKNRALDRLAPADRLPTRVNNNYTIIYTIPELSLEDNDSCKIEFDIMCQRAVSGPGKVALRLQEVDEVR